MDKEHATSITYASYLRVEELLGLQQEPRAHDELLFVVLHQSHELWFKLLLHELDDAVVLIDADRFPEAESRLRRAVTVMRQLVAQWDVLGTMSPAGYLSFRHALEGGSGFQSVQWREVEYRSGLKDTTYVDSHWLGDAERARLQRRLDEPSLADRYREALRRHGVDDVIEVLRGGREELALLSMLSESLLDYDEAVGHWRHRHVLAVERQIGLKRGTGGSSGVAYLRSTLTQRFFPELWEARTRL
ncbi:MAG TPA: tryptophan 2,3-dioxygenase family protein [Mycobacteriales bacterium]|nr:tryptophan 2,3-dioxygenase family protein [Mycobacteriales bacterium]